LIDSRLSLRASVGLMVLAPSPDMCGAVDCRLLDVEDGVCDRCAGDLPGERAWLRGMEFGSGVMDETARCPGCCLKGGWKDFAFAVRVAFGSLGTPILVVLSVPEYCHSPACSFPVARSCLSASFQGQRSCAALGLPGLGAPALETGSVAVSESPCLRGQAVASRTSRSQMQSTHRWASWRSTG
jgi:hypothetical protein